jgi:uncharacterized spore protein YtfJ
MSNFNDIMGNMTEFLKSEIRTETIIGQQFMLGEFTCVPVMAMGLGIGGGDGEGRDSVKGSGAGSGGGVGMGMTPVGFLVTRGNEIQFISTSSSTGFGAAIAKIPDLVERYYEKAQHSKANNV